MRFSGRHVDLFLGFPPTGKPVYWLGAALFQFDGTAISQHRVLGDLLGLEALLKAIRRRNTQMPPTRHVMPVGAWLNWRRKADPIKH